MPPTLNFPELLWRAFQQTTEAAYPFEGCGLLLGPLDRKKVVKKIVPLKNTLRDEGRGRFDFTFSAPEFMEAQQAAERENLDIVGIYHTHPDHPPRPSQTDSSQPMLSGWINVIAAVYGGKFKEAKAWWREEETVPFIETALVVES